MEIVFKSLQQYYIIFIYSSGIKCITVSLNTSGESK